MPVLRNIRLLATGLAAKPQSEIAQIQDAAIVWQSDTIAWIGAAKDLPTKFSKESPLDAQGSLAIPGLIDCHTHLGFAGWRADEFKRRILGESYLDIAKSGGGILSTVALTRKATKKELVERELGFLKEITSLGVTTVEAKSGYGLTLDDEIELLESYAEATKQSPLTIVPTFLGAHTIPAEFKNDRAAYIKLVTDQMLPAVAAKNLARFCDIFVEESAFSPDEARLILGKAQSLGLKLKLHVDQLSDLKGAELAVELGATSADHLEHTSDQGVAALGRSKTVAVLLPIASLYTRQPFVDARRLIDSGANVAISTDFNPGSAPSFHLPFAMMLGCTMCRLTPTEVFNGATLMAAKALSLDKEIGSLEVGKKADIALLNTESIDHWMYNFTGNVCRKVFKNGQEIHASAN